MTDQPKDDPLLETVTAALANRTPGPIVYVRYEHGGGRAYRSVPRPDVVAWGDQEDRTLVLDCYHEGDRELFFHAPEWLSALVERCKAAEDDGRLLTEHGLCLLERAESAEALNVTLTEERDRLKLALAVLIGGGVALPDATKGGTQ